jgi:2-(1,2-epoxy-1,2-dihydrophenyl)acetyl-CoA isomerase
MNFETISLSIEDGVALLALNRPDRLNSFNADMHEEMRQAMKAIKKDETVRCLVLTGNGRGFCAGQDLSDRNVAVDAEMPDLGL